MMKKEFVVKGMHCSSCEMLIMDALDELDGIEDVSVSAKKGTADITFDESRVSPEKISQVIRKEGFEVD